MDHVDADDVDDDVSRYRYDNIVNQIIIAVIFH